ncbi:unnamed protein product [Didymodactylos carnosus]|uniref:DYW domain-containing protein n=1 Tax=Didymodactylos carnosus TaxID=1234261 RepID=A0A815DZ20_9BILA|nr:unnamed protein product [Didymodactylos carnosus]CAF1303089.1 unnamed protein product [Didymodactylos carnosus]CAF4033844.1 unnamed protein product [Didymodactylos carnosus]CAF4130843.1 unnamed protein product [Didymodactylos carnosus]
MYKDLRSYSPHFHDQQDYVTSTTVLLANTYTLGGDWSTASDIRMKMNQSGMKKMAGLSWTVVDGKIVKFRAHGRSHPRSEEIYAELERLTNGLIEHGYKCDTCWITRPMMNDETRESVLSGHSERLAIAFNLIQQPVPSCIQILKNLRVCGDWRKLFSFDLLENFHCDLLVDTFIKLIARIHQCLIIVRDTNRTHHFHPNGQCPCRDYF